MQPFLKFVAEDILRKHGTDLSDIVIVFPNKRAALYMNQYLADAVRRPLFSPIYKTISELFCDKSGLGVADRITSVAVLYNVYKRIIPSAETIDRFWGWGEIILSDFDDIDKHLADARLVLANVADLHAYDNIDYIDQEKREMLRRFFAEFSEEHNTRLKERFRLLWNNLYAVYKAFNEAMRERGLSYEGALYRDVAGRLSAIEWEHKEYIFVGFNMLREAERNVFDTLLRQGKARFYWDFDRYYTDNPAQEAGAHIRRRLAKFPNELDINDDTLYNNFDNEKRITFLSAPTENIQARYIQTWLEEVNKENKGQGPCKREHELARCRVQPELGSSQTAAIVLADECLLSGVVHYLPVDVTDEVKVRANESTSSLDAECNRSSTTVNITVPLPLSETPARSLADNFLRLHVFAFNAADRTYLTKQVKLLLAHPYVNILSENAGELLKKLIEARTFNATTDELCIDEGLSLLFQPADGGELLHRLTEILSLIGVRSEQERRLDGEEKEPTYEEQMMQESVYQMYCAVNRLADIIAEEKLEIVPATLLRLLSQLVSTLSMPLHGEPVTPLQITGVLETRNLDFDRLLILSCNEGNMPKGVNSPSVIPYSVRKAHSLTTPDDKTAVYAYYFFRLIQRASDITIAYNSSTEDGRTGQMSRFMLQLMAETDPAKIHITHKTLTARQTPARSQAVAEIVKNDAVMRILNRINYLSPSAINKYMHCPLQFYFLYVAGIKEPDGDDMSDVRIFGNVFHTAAEKIYNGIIGEDKLLTCAAIEPLLADKSRDTIRRYVSEAITEEVFASRAGHYDGLLLINRETVVHYLQTLLAADRELAPIYICGLEKEIYGGVNITVCGQNRTVITGGRIDRLDRICTPDGAEILRVIDYKTGNHTQEILAGVEEVFNPDNIDRKRSDYYLQAMLYALLVRRSQNTYSYGGETYEPLNRDNLPVSPGLLFITKADSIKDPILKFGDKKNPKPVTDIADYETPFRKDLEKLIARILDPHIPFRPTDNDKLCSRCPYRTICRNH
ncbi:MAG: PD-(D/E)XK nuclease family protein [Prevotella sp.]|nr:PD-(D/E)XK nuclease family protein [Prevotella sp.]